MATNTLQHGDGDEPAPSYKCQICGERVAVTAQPTHITTRHPDSDENARRRRQAETRRQTYEQAHRRVLRETTSYRSALVIRRAALDALHAAAYVDAAAAGVAITTVGQAAVEAAWGKLPPCDRTLCGDAGAAVDFAMIVGHHDDCPRGRAIRALRIHGV